MSTPGNRNAGLSMARPTPRHRAFLYATAFASGLVSLAVELTASSLLRSHFGTANLVWAAIIGLMLLYLTAGYLIGGRYADRAPRSSVLFQILSWAGFLIGLVPFAARPILALASPSFVDLNAAALAGAFVAVLMLFSIPVTLLGCTSPFVIRLAVGDVQSAGRTAGLVYAVSTAGSFVGAFLPDLLLVPTIGTRNTFVLLSLFLSLFALTGLSRSRPRRLILYVWMPALIILLAILARGKPVKPTAGAIYETESGYNYIQVVERDDGCRQLLLNEGQGIHSIYCPDRLETEGPWDYFLIAPYFNAPPYAPAQVEAMALIGLAAGTSARQYTAAYGSIPIDGVEIDGEIVRVAREYFGMDSPNLNVIVADGRHFLAQSDRRYTVIAVDAYRLPYIPPHLTTVEFFLEARNHLTDQGVAAINVGHTPEDYRIVEAILATILEVFPSAHVVDVPNSFNAVIVATMQPSKPENLVENLSNLDKSDLLYTTALRAAANIRSMKPGEVVFTDDRAAIELMTNSLVFDYVLRGAMEKSPLGF